MVKEESLKNDILQESILVVIPTYNESENMPILLEKIFSLNLPRLSILIVDDSSPDNTGDIVRHIASQYNCLLYTSPSPRDGLLSRMPSSA